MLLGGMGFKPLSEIPNYKGRLDLCLKIEDNFFAIIELKYISKEKKLKKSEENKILTSVATSKLNQDEYNQALINSLTQKISQKGITNILINASKGTTLSITERENMLLMESMNILTDEDINKALADMIRSKLPDNEVQEIILKNVSSFDLSEEQIDDKLSKALEKALQDIKNRDYHSQINYNDSEVFDLALAIFGAGEKIKAKFAPK
jgi:hypothetical protein